MSNQNVLNEQLRRAFQSTFESEPFIYSAPVRVNLIGEHTDYNEGFVMPCAINFDTHVAIAPNNTRKLSLRSVEYPEAFVFDIDEFPVSKIGAWPDYVLGTAVMLKKAGCQLTGADLLIRSQVPIGAGLSSSAALEVATAMALMHVSGTKFPWRDVAKLCQKAENEFVGARVGIMDQFTACFWKADSALLLDCGSLEFQWIRLPSNIRLVICNTMVKHDLATGEYNRRRAECEAGVTAMRSQDSAIRSLRDVTLKQLQGSQSKLSETIYKRCLHVVEENQRVLDGARALAESDVQHFGELMGESHRSLRDLYEVSCRELDTMVELAEGLPGYHGGRMTGGGFGGCTVNLVDASECDRFASQIAGRYHDATGIKPDIYICSASDGASAREEANE